MNNVEEILRKFKLDGPYPQDKYIRYVEKTFGKDGAKFIDLADATLSSGSSLRQLYGRKNKNKDMSLYVSSHCNTSLYRGILNWLSNIAPPESFIELGCENGVLTFCVSDLWPNSTASGVDSIGIAISTARKLSYQFGKSDAKFYVADFAQKDSTADIPKSNILLAPFLFHELLDCPDEDWEYIAENIKQMMFDNSLLITINRFPWPSVQFPRLDSRLSKIGISRISTDALQVGDESFPTAVYGKLGLHTPLGLPEAESTVADPGII